MANDMYFGWGISVLLQVCWFYQTLTWLRRPGNMWGRYRIDTHLHSRHTPFVPLAIISHRWCTFLTHDLDISECPQILTILSWLCRILINSFLAGRTKIWILQNWPDAQKCNLIYLCMALGHMCINANLLYSKFALVWLTVPYQNLFQISTKWYKNMIGDLSNTHTCMNCVLDCSTRYEISC